MNREFSFDSAFLHFLRVDGPKGFLWKFVLVYVAIILLVIVAAGFLFGGAFLSLMETAGDPQTGDADEVFAMMAPILLMYAVAIPLFMLFWAVMEASIMRRYVRGTGFTIGVGADEFRLIVVALIWGLIATGAYILVAALIGGSVAAIGAIGGFDNPAPMILAGVILGLLAFGFLFYWAVRLSPASAMTIRDRKIRFFSAAGATKGRFWPMFGAFLVLVIIAMIVSTVLQLLLIVAASAGMMANSEQLEAMDDPAEVMAMFTSLGFLVPVLIGYGFYMAFNAVFHYMWAGVPARAAITDPRWDDSDKTASVFT